MKEAQIASLITAALEVRRKAYAPYSGYGVGAALLTGEGKLYTGTNVENASFGAANCAERTAFFQAVSAGERHFQGIAVCGGLAGQEPVDYAYPCGICRQVFQEFCGRDFQIIVAKSSKDYQIFTLEELLPKGFGGASIR